MRFYLIIVEAGAFTEALLEDVDGDGEYDPIYEIPLEDLYGENGLFPIRVLPGNDPPIEETVTFHCLQP